MPPNNVDIVRKAYDAVNLGDLDMAVSCIAPDMEYVASGAVPGAMSTKKRSSVAAFSGGASR